VLVVLREQQDREGQEALYAHTLRLLSGGDQQVSFLGRVLGLSLRV